MGINQSGPGGGSRTVPEAASGQEAPATEELPGKPIPVYRPRLPSAHDLRPYLETLDHTRCYSNHGPLERQLATRLSRLLGSEAPITATASSGTAALTGA